MNRQPFISIVIPTFNSVRTLPKCLEAARAQRYPAKLLEVVIADAGSTDDTLEIAKRFAVNKVVPNPLVTGEAGKAAGIAVASGDIIALIDSDNILDGEDWLERMAAPFADPEIVASEPLYYTYHADDTLVNRYCALLGMNDPLCLYIGNYDRYSYATDAWTGMSIPVEQRDGYMVAELNRENVPTIGANGFLVRKNALLKTDYTPYLFDIDVVHQLVENGHTKFAKVDIGITHLFAGTVKDFVRKQRRRIKDYSYFSRSGMRTYPWRKRSSRGIIRFCVSTVLVVPLFWTALRGYSRKSDRAWLFHPVACWITLWVYGWGRIAAMLGAGSADRSGWRQ